MNIRHMVLGIALLCMTACGERIVPAPKAGDVYYIPATEWRIVSEQDMRKIYIDAGMPLQDAQELQGFVGTVGGKSVIYTTTPDRVDGVVTTTLGHEVMHLTLGAYHSVSKKGK